MNDHPSSFHDRIEELLAERALWGLDDESQRELDGLLAEHGDDIGDVDKLAASLEMSVARIDLAAGPNVKADMPDALARGIEADIISRMRGEGDAEAPAVAGKVGPNSWAPWIVAAASLLLAAVAWLAGPSITQSTRNPAVARYELMNNAPDALQLDWQALEDPSVTPATSGDVVWSDSLQVGFMRFDGLAVNDPTQEQYQLWIFDADRPDETPVDGGVFDVTSTGEVYVRIDPKIEVHEATMFAITVERPGGVVVSDRSRLPLLAAPKSG